MVTLEVTFNALVLLPNVLIPTQYTIGLIPSAHYTIHNTRNTVQHLELIATVVPELQRG